MEHRNLSYVSLFSGAGGLDLGLEMAGWKTVYASDHDPCAVQTLRLNMGAEIARARKAFDGTLIEHADVTQLEGSSILSKCGISRGGVPLLVGGPPCQSWSSAGHQLGFDDPRGRLFDDFVRVAQEMDARWLLLENVRGLLTARGPDGEPGSALLHVRRTLLAAGFQTTVALLNAADFGVPQRRVRLFILGFRAGDAPTFPVPTHSKHSDQASASRWISLSETLRSLGAPLETEVFRPTGKLAADLATIAPGTGVKSPGKAERTRPGGHWGYKQGAFVADPAQPARTVTASAQQDWVRDPVYGIRRLCPRECAAIQGFPPSWRFAGNVAAQYRLIGNAVPPPLAAAIGARLLLEAGPSRNLKPVALDEPIPLPEKLAYHVRYTAKEEAANGPSRRAGATKRGSRSANTGLVSTCP